MHRRRKMHPQKEDASFSEVHLSTKCILLENESRSRTHSGESDTRPDALVSRPRYVIYNRIEGKTESKTGIQEGLGEMTRVMREAYGVAQSGTERERKGEAKEVGVEGVTQRNECMIWERDVENSEPESFGMDEQKARGNHSRRQIMMSNDVK